MAVRKAEKSDLDRVFAMMEDMAQESVYREMPLNRPKMRAFLEHLIQNPATVLFVYTDEKGEVGGVYAGRVGDYWFSDSKAAFDVVFYVAPGCRGSGAAAELWTAFADWGRSMGAMHVWPGVSSGIAPEKAARFYLKQGVEQVGGVFLGRL
jgi:GNAT superfamily N-acetyltransferase